MKKSVLIALAIAAGAHPGNASAASCGTSGRTIAANDVARVFSAPDRHRGNRRYVFGCVIGGRRPIRLARLHVTQVRPSATAYITGSYDVQLVGDFVAYRLWWFPADREDTSGYVVRNLRTGKVSLQVGAYNPNPGQAVEIDSFVVKPNGSTAWIDVSNLQHGVVVHALDSTGRRVLDYSDKADIGLHSMGLALDTVYWTKGGTAYSAPLR